MFDRRSVLKDKEIRFRPSTSNLRGRLPKQIQRALPFYAVCILLIFYFSNAETISNTFSSSVSKRSASSSTQDPFHSLGGSGINSVSQPKFPRKIWQSWKVDAFAFEERDLTRARTWTAKNPSYRYEVLTDYNDMQYVEAHYGPSGFNRPDIVNVYQSLTAKIIKADLLRYLVMYAEGGVYADIDVEALRSVDRFIPDRYNEMDVDMVIGVEIDQPEYAAHPILGPKSQSFCQWTFMCKPRLPVMLRLIDNILAWLNGIAQQQGVPLSNIELDFDDVLGGTGPSAFTTAVLAEMSAATGMIITWDNFHAMQESKLVGGFLVLTVEAFAAGQGHSDSGNHNARSALVKHHYHASGWPTKHPRYSHPVYGEVERCNWVKECVDNWDRNKQLFESLPPEEQVKQIWDKVAADSQIVPNFPAAAEGLQAGAPLNFPPPENPIPQQQEPLLLMG